MGRVAWAFVKRDFLLELSYRTAFILKLLFIFSAVPVIYFISQVFTEAQTDALGEFGRGAGYFGFLLIGIAFQDYVTYSQSAFNSNIREHQVMGTLEIVMLSPTPVVLIPIFSSLWGYISTSFRFLAFLGFGIIFGLDISRIDILALVLTVFLSIMSMSAIAMLSASLVILIKRGGEMITVLLTGATVLFSGVVYPVAVLPPWMQTLSELLPYTHALEAMRKTILLGAGVGDIAPELKILILFAGALFPLGIYAFHLAVRRARVLGSLGQY